MPGVAKVVREDLYNKRISADPVSVRLPYATITKQVELRGWKRFEIDDTPKFRGTTEATFNSIYRRSLVTELKAQFLCRQELLRRFFGGDNEVSGVFGADPSLKDFLKGPDAAAAFLR